MTVTWWSHDSSIWFTLTLQRFKLREMGIFTFEVDWKESRTEGEGKVEGRVCVCVKVCIPLMTPACPF